MSFEFKVPKFYENLELWISTIYTDTIYIAPPDCKNPGYLIPAVLFIKVEFLMINDPESIEIYIAPPLSLLKLFSKFELHISIILYALC